MSKAGLLRYFLYLCRWQLSTPPLALCIWLLSGFNPWVATIVANLIGGLIFFWIDRFIFTNKMLNEAWEIREAVECSDCGKSCRGYRLVYTEGYDKTNDPKPEFRCETCSIQKAQAIRARS